MMERLTRKYEDGSAFTDGVITHDCNCFKSYTGEPIIKLSKYEDAEEKGLLKIFPCKVGEKVIILFDDNGEIFITHGWFLEIIEIYEDDIICSFYCHETKDRHKDSISGFGKTVFLDIK